MPALDTVVTVLSEDPEFYFTNPGEPFKISHYWEHIVDQLAIMSRFLQEAAVDSHTGKITKPENIDIFSAVGFGKLKDSKYLATVFCDLPGKATYYAFYALFFDYLVKLFNEGILLFEVGQAMRYYPELEFVVGKLRGSVNYEVDYQEHLKTSQELLNLLKQKLGVHDDLLEPSMSGRKERRAQRDVW